MAPRGQTGTQFHDSSTTVPRQFHASSSSTPETGQNHASSSPTARDLILTTQTFFVTARDLILTTQTFFATARDLIITTETFFATARDLISYYTNFFRYCSRPHFLIHKLFSLLLRFRYCTATLNYCHPNPWESLSSREARYVIYIQEK